MYRTFLSLRYLRSRRTNWIGIAGIFVAVTALILILSIMSGFLAESRSHLRGNLSDVLIQPMPDRRTGSYLVDSPEPILEVVRDEPGVEAACVQLQWMGMLTPPRKAHVLGDPMYADLALVRLIGIDVEDEFATTGFHEALVNEPLSPLADRVVDVDDPFAPPPGYRPSSRPVPGVLVGEQLALQWGLERGEEVEISTTALDRDTGEIAEPSNGRYVVSGVFRSGENETDMGRVYFDRRTLSDLLGNTEDFTTILVKLEDYPRDGKRISRELEEKLFQAGLIQDPVLTRGGEVRTWEDFKRTWLAAVENEKALMGVMLSLVMIVAGFTVFALLSMMVTEKRRDIGIISALGGTSRGVLVLFLLIGLWQAALGALLGTVAGVLGARNIDAIERWLSDTLGVQIFDRSVYYFDHIPAVVHPVGVGLIVLGAFTCTLAFAAIPAWKASRMHPIDALRYE